VNDEEKVGAFHMERRIGVIDSGVGGLTVAYELMRQLPNESFIYIGDTLRCPYGSRSTEEIVQYTLEMVDFLLKKEVKMIVIACNTATAYTLKHLQETLTIPIIGVVNPGARAAIKTTRTNHVGIIGTEGTVRSKAYKQALQTIHPKMNVTSLACPTFVPMIEAGILSGEKAEQVVKEALQPLQDKKEMDTLILGCTHYPLIGQVIQSVMGKTVTVISSSDETARETSIMLDVHQLLAQENAAKENEFYATGDLHSFQRITKLLFENAGETFDSFSVKHTIL